MHLRETAQWAVKKENKIMHLFLSFCLHNKPNKHAECVRVCFLWVCVCLSAGVFSRMLRCSYVCLPAHWRVYMTFSPLCCGGGCVAAAS